MAFKQVDRKVGRSGRQVVGAQEVYFKQKRRSLRTFKRSIGPSDFPFCLILENNRYYLLKSSDKSHTKQYHVLSSCLVVN